MKRVLQVGLINTLTYFVLAWNTRVTAQGNVPWTFVSDVALGFLYYELVQRITQSRSVASAIAYSLGGGVGAVAAIYATKWIVGQ